MNDSYIISFNIKGEKIKKCIHNNNTKYYEEKIQNDDNSYSTICKCLKCNQLLKWKKKGRFFYKIDINE